MLLSQPLTQLHSYATITSSSAIEVLQHFLNLRLQDINSSISAHSRDSSNVIYIIQAVKSTIADVNELFPTLYERTMGEIKSTPLLSHPALKTLLLKRSSVSQLWMKDETKSFLIWTKSDVLSASQVQELVSTWTNQVSDLIQSKGEGLFTGIEDLEILLIVRKEILSLLGREDGDFEKRMCRELVNFLAAQINRLLTTRISKIHEWEHMASEIINNFQGAAILTWIDSSGGCQSQYLGFKSCERTARDCSP
jgi:hypothetical protein